MLLYGGNDLQEKFLQQIEHPYEEILVLLKAARGEFCNR
jgi:hypothetical protein